MRQIGTGLLTMLVTFGMGIAIHSARSIDKGKPAGLSPILVAKVKIPAGSRIIPEQVELVQFPANVNRQGTFALIDERIIGRVVKLSVRPHEPITESHLAPVGAAGGLSSMIPEGYRFMDVRVDKVVGESSLLKWGTLVDISVVTSAPKSSERTVLQYIKILSCCHGLDMIPKNDPRARETFATLQVTPEQAEKLALALSEGKIQLVIRSPFTDDE